MDYRKIQVYGKKSFLSKILSKKSGWIKLSFNFKDDWKNEY